jgi:hypothetical protein
MAEEGGEGQSPLSEGQRPPVSLTDIVLALIVLVIAGPFCGAGAEAVLHGEYFRATVGFIIGVPLAISALAFPFLNRRRGLWRNAVNWHGRWALPIAFLIAFAYVVGPDLYRRATYVAVTPSTSPPPAPTADEIAKAVVRAMGAEPKKTTASQTPAASTGGQEICLRLDQDSPGEWS